MKSIKINSENWICSRDNTVTRWSSLSPNPATAYIIMVKNAPEVVLSSLSLFPVPEFFNFDGRTVHLFHIETIIESSKFSVSAKCILTKSSSAKIAVDL